MPRVSPEHEQAVRARIVDAAIKVFGDLGYDRASIQDVVRESGLSVGAVYTHFKGKDELFLVACACQAERETTALGLRLAELGGVSDRLRVAVDWAISSVEEATLKSALTLHAWAHADNSAELRRVLQERQKDMIGFATQILQDAVAAGELPAWIDAEGVAAAFITFVNGFALLKPDIDAESARRQGYALLELLLAAPTERPVAVDRLRLTESKARA